MGAAAGPLLGAVAGGGDDKPGPYQNEQGQAGYGNMSGGGGGGGQLLSAAFGGSSGQQPRSGQAPPSSGPPSATSHPPPGYGQQPQLQPVPWGQPSQAPQGMDFQGPGVAEQTQQSIQGAYNQPSMASNYFASSMPGMMAGNTNAQTAFNNFQAGPHDFSPYFDRAKTRTLGSMNDQAAARGTYGSSSTLNGLGDASAAIDAEQANREATYNLQRAQSAGALGSAADSSNLARYGLGSSMAGQVDQTQLAQLSGMMNAAGMAQDARRTRGQDMFNNIWAPSAMMMGMNQQSMDQMLADDAALMDAIAALELGAAGEGVRADQYQDAQVRGDIGAQNAAMWQMLSGPLG